LGEDGVENLLGADGVVGLFGEDGVGGLLGEDGVGGLLDEEGDWAGAGTVIGQSGQRFRATNPVKSLATRVS